MTAKSQESKYQGEVGDEEGRNLLYKIHANDVLLIHKTISTMGWAQQMSSFFSVAVHSRSDHMPSLPGDNGQHAGSSPKSPALGFSVAVHSRSDHMPTLPGDNGQHVPPMHILRQASRQESSSSIGSSRGASQEFMRVGSSGSSQRVSIDSQRISRMPSLPGDNAQQVHSMRFLRQAYREVSRN
jgi:hypothetical protein